MIFLQFCKRLREDLLLISSYYTSKQHNETDQLILCLRELNDENLVTAVFN